MNFVVLGSGAWGTALSIHLLRIGHTVTLVSRRLEQATEMASSRENKDYLPGVHLPEELQLGHEILPTIMEADVVLFACPAKGLRDLAEKVAGLTDTTWSLSAAIAVCKGLDPKTFSLPTDVLKEYFPNIPSGMLSGPTNAAELAEKKPSAAVLAFDRENEWTHRLQTSMSDQVFRLYGSHDPTGVALGGALKNIYAIASGCCDGLRLGDNAKAALLTRSLSEMIQIGSALGGEKETFIGLSGFGDLVATSYGSWSRNRTFGESIGKGSDVNSQLKERKTVVEGASSVEWLKKRCEKIDISTPILNEVYEVVLNGKPPAKAMADLMARSLKKEI